MTVPPSYGTLPANVSKHGETHIFTAQTVPKKLTQEHRTKDGVWGLICVDAGSLDYEILGSSPRTLPLCAGDKAILKPQEPHKVRPAADASFKVEFYSRSKSDGA